MKKELYVKKPHPDYGTWLIIILCWVVVWGAWLIATAGR